MILTCPICNSRYLVPATHFAAGPRQVRCARCFHTWLGELPKEPASALAAQLLNITPPPLTATPIPPGSNLPALREKPLHKWYPWIALFGIVILGLFAVWFWLDRQEIAKMWPVLEGTYEKLGLHIYHPGEGLSLQQVRSELHGEDGIPMLIVEGKILNETPKTQQIPNLMAVAVGSDGKPMQSWQIDAPAATLNAAETVSFQSTIRSPKGTVVEINLSFIEPKHAP